ncbi:hypothetical protein P691DRAFT_764730 [Macrolepiota fuliginosa MF-IS2]|uniref:Uncharacterized protein n=1 Tax=Macrolepiota fuliginosa MF-IS2 TaxID=1400762 RepID=A0A9P5X504_9AGAR|nr:hypothetical protein P691DRAFT_764730 [Macrolepiota fuliginosa MF-IS2]
MSATGETSCVQQLQMNMWTSFGMVITALFIGSFLTLAVPSMYILSPRQTSRRRLWKIYIAILIAANLGYEAVCFLWNTYRITYALVNPVNGAKFSRALAICCSIFPVFIVAMTDAIIIWRCYTIQETMGLGSSRLGRVFYFFPLCLWVVTTGAAGAAFIGDTHLVTIFQTMAVVSNILLNVFATCFIITRLLLHRRMLVACFGEATPDIGHLRIVNILIESAAINIPITVVGVIGLAVGPIFGDIVGAIAVACQSFASVLIFHRIAAGRAIGYQDGTDSLTTRFDLHSSEHAAS